MTDPAIDVVVRPTRPSDFPAIAAITREVYPASPPWNEEQLASHLRVFPEGQLVAVDPARDEVAGMAASLIVLWDEYETADTWRDFTDHGMFTNHDPEYGHTLYGAEIMVHPSCQGRGVGSALYWARRDLVRRFGLWRIRAGARLRGYHRHADAMTAREYVQRVIRGELRDPTLSFQIGHGFTVLAVVKDYLRHDPESLGHAAVIEWLSPDAPPEATANAVRPFEQ